MSAHWGVSKPRAEGTQMELGWRRTWHDIGKEDYALVDAARRHLGRAYIDQRGNWRWFFAGSSGLADSRREALLAVELAYKRRARCQETARTGRAGPQG